MQRQADPFGSSISTPSNPQANPQEVADLPLISEASKSELFDPNTHMTKIAYLYDPKRGERHFNARVYLHGLYHTGAVLINKGLAYQDDPKVLKLASGEVIVDLSGEPMSDSERRHQLLAYYDNLECFKNTRRSATSINPLHALFILKVALDHLSASAIFLSAKKLLGEASEMTFSPVSVVFPNGSYFADDHAAGVVLGHYILNNPARFTEFASTRFMDRLKRMAEDNRELLLLPYSVMGTSSGNLVLDAVGYRKTLKEMLAMDALNPPPQTKLIASRNQDATALILTEDDECYQSEQPQPVMKSWFSFFGLSGWKDYFYPASDEDDNDKSNTCRQ